MTRQELWSGNRERLAFLDANEDELLTPAELLGRATGAARQVLTGVREGERVVLSPPASLKGGEAVRLADKT